MATQFAATLNVPAATPFLFRGSAPEKTGRNFAEAMRAAVAADRAQGGGRKSCQRIAYFLCELGKVYGCRSDLPLSRAAIVSALGISLVRVKRTLGLLSLSGVLTSRADSLTILDWRKLGGVARFDRSSLDLAEDDEEDLICSAPAALEGNFTTASGEPACFV